MLCTSESDYSVTICQLYTPCQMETIQFSYRLLVTVQKDLGVYITNDLKSTEQCIQTNFRKHKLVLVVMSTTSGLDLDDLHCDWSVWTGLSIAACALCTGIANFGRGPLRLLAVSNLVCCIIALLN